MRHVYTSPQAVYYKIILCSLLYHQSAVCLCDRMYCIRYIHDSLPVSEFDLALCLHDVYGAFYRSNYLV